MEFPQAFVIVRPDRVPRELLPGLPPVLRDRGLAGAQRAVIARRCVSSSEQSRQEITHTAALAGRDLD
jgi:hypothetical protein